MAMDTRTKRVSAFFVRLPFCRRSLPEANGAIDQADRECTAGDYAGIAAASPVIVVDPEEITAEFTVTAPEFARLIVTDESLAEFLQADAASGARLTVTDNDTADFSTTDERYAGL